MTDNTPSCSLTLTKVMFGSYITFGIDARDFHRELAVTEEFSEWIKVRIASHKFLENQDFISREKSDRQLNGTPELDYVISIDMANQMAFNELSPNRAQVRRFLLDAERLSTSQLISTYRATFDRQLDEIIDLKVNKSVNKSLPLLLAQMLTDRRIQVRYGKTAGQIWKDKGFPSLRLHQWFGNKLEKSGCLVEGSGYGELGNTRARLFDPDKVNRWLKAGGRREVDRKILEHLGQGNFGFIFPSDSVSPPRPAAKAGCDARRSRR